MIAERDPVQRILVDSGATFDGTMLQFIEEFRLPGNIDVDAAIDFSFMVLRAEHVEIVYDEDALRRNDATV